MNPNFWAHWPHQKGSKETAMCVQPCLLSFVVDLVFCSSHETVFFQHESIVQTRWIDIWMVSSMRLCIYYVTLYVLYLFFKEYIHVSFTHKYTHSHAPQRHTTFRNALRLQWEFVCEFGFRSRLDFRGVWGIDFGKSWGRNSGEYWWTCISQILVLGLAYLPHGLNLW